jgi:hypothetical protein
MAIHGDNYWLQKIANGGLVAGGTVDGADATQGSVNDAANTTGTTGTVSGKLRGMVTILGDVWDSVTHAFRVKETYAPLYEDNVAQVAKVEQRNTPTYISSATTTVVKTGSGFFHKLIVNGGTTGTIIVYDNTAASGTIIASFDTTNALASYEFNVTFATGLTIVTSAATKVTVAWR